MREVLNYLIFIFLVIVLVGLGYLIFVHKNFTEELVSSKIRFETAFHLVRMKDIEQDSLICEIIDSLKITNQRLDLINKDVIKIKKKLKKIDILLRFLLPNEEGITK